VFDGLLPEPHNGRILRLLFVLAHWHGLAKLRMHTDSTLNVLDAVTTDLGNQLRTFKRETCAEFETKELRRESVARVRRQNRSSRLSTTIAKTQQSEVEPSTSRRVAVPYSQNGTSGRHTSTASHDNTRRAKSLNLNTYKFHALGDYTSTIRRFGTTDSYSTEPVRPFSSCFLITLISSHQAELEHRTPKSRYARTSKKDFTKQMAQIERRQARIRRVRQKLAKKVKAASEAVPDIPDKPYNIGKCQNHPVNITQFIQQHVDDPAVKVSHPYACV
jgi:hypothetical protein